MLRGKQYWCNYVFLPRSASSTNDKKQKQNNPQWDKKSLRERVKKTIIHHPMYHISSKYLKKEKFQHLIKIERNFSPLFSSQGFFHKGKGVHTKSLTSTGISLLGRNTAIKTTTNTHFAFLWHFSLDIVQGRPWFWIQLS